MLETKVVPQSYVYHLNCHCDKLPAPVANIGFVAARSNIIVIRQINIEAEFFR